MERRLWPDGGYYLDNGASVCGPCHVKCESTEIDPQTLRARASIQTVLLPPHLYRDDEYDKWGNIILPNGRRIPGELFHDSSVQKILQQGPHWNAFSSHVKYPRTHHLPWSPGQTEDDRVMSSLDTLKAEEIVITEKMDGENTTMYRDYIHARSLAEMSHPSQSWIKNYWTGVCHQIPHGWRVCGENLFAVHSIRYHELPAFFLGFSVWNERNVALSWDETIEWLQLLDIQPVPTLYRGQYDQAVVDRITADVDGRSDRIEGYVIRNTAEISYGQFRTRVGKYVRASHVQTAHNWRNRWSGEKNQLCRARL